MEKKLRIMVIGAHPDDNESKTGGTAAKYRTLGHHVKYVYATNGDTGHFKIGGGSLARIRAEEACQACAIIGIEPMVLDIHNNGLEADIPTRERFIRIIREYRPDIIITHRPNDYHPDHRRTSMLVQDCSYAVRVPNVCPLTPHLEYSPVILYMKDNFKRPYEFVPDIVVNIDDVIDTKIKMLDCHKSQMYEWGPWVNKKSADIPDNPEKRLQWLKKERGKRDIDVAEKFRSRLVEFYGEERGEKVVYAEAFEISEYGGALTEEKISYYFPFCTKEK